MMNWRLRGILRAGVTAGLITCAGGSLSAQQLPLNTDRQWYAQGFAGVNFSQGVEVSDGTPPDLNHDLTFDAGYALGGAVGVTFDSGLRLEAEASYRTNGPDELCFQATCGGPAAPAGSGVDGEMSAVALMVNALYDFDTGTPFTPYLGAGMGIGNVDYAVDVAGASYRADSWGLALQVIAGLSYQVTAQLAVFADYRFLTILDSEVSAVHTPGGYMVAVEDDYAAHSFLVGLRYLFGAGERRPAEGHAAPAAGVTDREPGPETVSAAAPGEPEAVLQRHVVVFEGSVTELSQAARAVIISALDEYGDSGFVRVFAQGTTGVFSGGADLAMSRAHAIRRDLLSRGVSPEQIVVRAFGSEHPLIPTPGGTPALGTPRVEVILL